MKKKILFFMLILFGIVYTGCGENTIEVGEAIKSPFGEGNLYYTISDTNEYESLEEASLSLEEIVMPYNTYGTQEIQGKYIQLSDYIEQDNIVKTPNRFIVLDVHIKNHDAIGMFKKDEFMINELCLYGEKTKTQYYPAYFSKAGEVDQEQIFHYKLKQGQEEKIQLGYLVLEDDLEELVGKINETKFKIYR